VAISGVPYLTRRGEVYWFRMAVPRGLRNRFGGLEIKGTLKTVDRSVAKLRCRLLTNLIETLIGVVIKDPTMARSVVHTLIRRCFQRCLFDLQVQSTALKRMGASGVDAAERKLADARASEGLDWGSILGSMEIDVDAECIGFRPTPADQAQLTDGLHRARIEAARILLAQVKGEYDRALALDPLFSGIDIFRQTRDTLEALPKANSPANDISVSEASVRYCALKSASAWSAKTLSENERVLALFQQLLGQDRPLKSIVTADVRDFRDTLLKLPANYMKLKSYAGMRLADVIASAGNQPVLATRTARKYLHNLRAFVKWSSEEGYIDSIPGPGIQIEGLTAAQMRDARHPFSDESLQKLFASPQYKGHRNEATRSKPGQLIIRDGKFWIPLIGLFTGMRLGEIVQLLASDIRTEDGVPFFDVTIHEGEEKQLKTDASRRGPPPEKWSALNSVF